MFLIHTKTGRRYEVISLNRDAGLIVLKGELAEFTEPYNKERFKELGYILEKDKADAVE
jgi:hypothetical protein